jgi:hypothetical protein
VLSKVPEAGITAERVAVNEYTKLVDQYKLLFKDWSIIVNEQNIEYLVSIVNERIITVRTINALAEAHNYPLPDSYTPTRVFYEDLYDEIGLLIKDIVYARDEITLLHDYIEARGGLSAPGIENDPGVKNILRTFIDDVLLSNPEFFATALTSHKAEVARLDSDYVQIMKTIEADILKFAKENSIPSSTKKIPCWQVQIEFKDAWKAINEKYTAEGSFYSSNRGIEVDNLAATYEKNHPNCF